MESEGGKQKPLIIYLHGYKQNINLFEKKVSGLLSLDVHHLLLQGPYPIYDENHKREVENWGRAWYLYDGRQEQFRKSMEKSAQFIEQIIDEVLSSVSVSNVTAFGYSMGGYLAGYFALSRPDLIKNLIVIGGRIKTEWFTDHRYEDLNVLALHGSKDNSVKASSAKKSALELEKKGAAVTFRSIEEGHRLSQKYVNEAGEWMSRQGA